MKNITFLALFGCLVLGILSGCADVRLETLKNISEQSDAVRLSFYDEEGKVSSDLLISEPTEILNMVSYATGAQSLKEDCGFSGKIEMLSGDEVLLQMEYNLVEACQHISYEAAGETYDDKLSPAGYAYLIEKRGVALSQADAKNHLDAMKWVVGKWKAQSQAGIVYENWEEDGERLDGKTFVVNSTGDTIHREEMELKVIKGTLTYISYPDNSTTIPFKLIEIDEYKAVYENAAHNFPKKFTYEKISEDEWRATLQGVEMGDVNNMEFRYERIIE